MVFCGTGYEALSFAIKKNSSSAIKKLLSGPDALIIDETWTDYILLIQALQRGRKKIAKLLLDRGCRVNKPIKTNFFHTPLYYAVRFDNADLVEILLDKGALINGRDATEDTPLRLALREKSYGIVDIMLSRYFNQRKIFSTFSDDDCIAFNAACIRGRTSVIDEFIKLGILNPKSIFESGGPLHFAVQDGNLEVIHELLNYKADINFKNKVGQTALHLAQYLRGQCYPSKHSLTIIELLLSELKKTNNNPVDKHGLSHFHVACTVDQPEIVKCILQRKVDINCPVNFDSPFWSGYTPLHFAIKNKQQKIIELLLSHGADMTIRNTAGDSPFHFAFSFFHSDDEFINLILSKYITKSSNPVNNNGLSYFHIACTTNNIGAIEAFLQSGVMIDTPIHSDSSKCPGYTPLHYAVTFNRRKTVKTLLENGANPNIKEKNGFTPLHLACQQSAKKIHTILRKSVNTAAAYGKIDFEFEFKSSPKKMLDNIASQNEQIEIVELLLQYKSDVNSQDSLGKTPLFYACDIDNDTFECEFGRRMTQTLQFIINEFYVKRDKIIETLLKSKPDVNITDKNGQTVLHCIADTEKVFRDDKKAEITQILINYGANINIQSLKGSTPLHIALRKVHLDLIKIYLKYNFNPNIAEYESGCTPLHIAASNDLLAPDSEEIINALLAKNADIHAKKNDGQTSLHLAALTRYCPSRLTPLLELDCNVDCQDNAGKTPLHMACLNRNAKNVENLLNKGADINVKDGSGCTPFWYFYQYQIEVLGRMIYDFHQIYYIFRNHIRKLRAIGFYVCWENIQYYIKLKDSNTEPVNNDNFPLQCQNEIDKMKHLRLNGYSTLYDILFKDPNEMSIYAKNDKLQKVIESSSFKTDYTHYSYLIELQVKRGLVRSEILNSAKMSLGILLGVHLPDTCSERIFRYLCNKVLKDIIEAAELYR
ncbi:serine/threonine-protein phosphatase 6 regulatory ankyrin repeat subunit B-like [Phymastichus coffea]|uniref:serine/threonine-protein phosphatase 6 regulatory ankyrin repeat subunit B-like n=1 Tax=Phymastichus coffea TaxID=108790 RepID=UPI00273CDD33|nr:serine/threonine-protein phosphatase 6 regulatory ankyrin repeat subunit B-like [Phymastichus coffea]